MNQRARATSFVYCDVWDGSFNEVQVHIMLKGLSPMETLSNDHSNYATVQPHLPQPEWQKDIPKVWGHFRLSISWVQLQAVWLWGRCFYGQYLAIRTRWFRCPRGCKEVWTSRCLRELNNPSLIIEKGKYLMPQSFSTSLCICVCVSPRVSALKCSF